MLCLVERKAKLVAKKALKVSFILFLFSVCFLVTRIASLEGILYVGATLLVFALPGLFVGMALFGRRFYKRPESLIFGAAIGIALSEFQALAIGYMFAWSVGLILTGLVCLSLVCAALTRTYWDRPLLRATREWESGDYAILLSMSVVLVGFVTIPFLNVGNLAGQEHAYTWLFGFDFLHRSTIAVSITQGLPPDYLHLTGEPLRYYLVSYTLPAFAYSSASKLVPMHSILLLVQLSLSLLFIGCLYAFLRHFIASWKALAWTAMVAMAGYSYYAWYVLAKRVLLELPEYWTPLLDASKLLQFGDVSHLFQRLFLVEAQALTGLCIFLFVVYVLELVKYRITSYGLAIVLGLALGIEFGIEGWQALVLLAWFGSVQALRWVRLRHRVEGERGPLATVLVLCTVVYVSFFALGVYEISSGQAISVTPYWWALGFAPIYFPIEYGPMFLLGLWGLRHQWQQNPSRVSMPLLVLAGLTLGQVFFVSASVMETFGVLRGNRLLPLVLLVWTGYFFQEMFRGVSARSTQALALAIVLAAVPTFFTDIYFSSNVEDRNNTRYVMEADLLACEWIRQNLPETALVQSEPDYVTSPDLLQKQGPPLSLIANFAERRMVLGEYWIASTIIVNSEAIARSRSHDLRRMFRASKTDQVLEVVDKYHIDYLYAGPYEQRLYPTFLELLKAARPFFQEVYSKHGVPIFKRNHTMIPLTRLSDQSASKESGAHR